MPLDFTSYENITIGILILIQLFVTFRLIVKIIIYRNIFKNAPTVASKYTTNDTLDLDNIRSFLNGITAEETSTDSEEISYLEESLVNNKIIKNIVEPINNYVVKNKGIAIDFHILKDIVERNVEIIEEEISNRVPAPLYIGLAATMLGIIFGLVAVEFDTTNTNANLALEAMKPLIDGVRIAMSASVLGLALTTIFSVWIFKNAKAKVEKDKSEFLSLIQSELMPKMNRSKLPEVALLAQKLDKFSRETSGVVSNLGAIVSKSKASIEQEQRLLNDIKKLDVRKVSSMNLQIFNKLDEMMSSFQYFATYYERLNKSLVNTTKLVEHLEQFVSNTEDINSVLTDLKSISSKSDESAQFFNRHIKSFATYGQAVNESIADSDSKMSRAIDTLGESAKKQFEAFSQILGEYDIKLSTSFDNSIERFNKTMQQQAEKTIVALDAARPKFEKLNQLDKLDTIEKRLDNLETGIVNALNTNNRDLIQVLKKTQENDTQSVIMHPEAYHNVVEKEEEENTWVAKVTFGLKISSYIIIIITGAIICYSILF